MRLHLPNRQSNHPSNRQWHEMVLPPVPLNFGQRSLQNRSFRRQRLDGANFAGADLRGCDFSGTSLRGCCLDGVKTGWTWLQLLQLAGWMGVPGWVFAEALTRLIFGALGQTPDEATWGFVLVLYGTLAIAGLGGLFPIHHNRVVGRWLRSLVGIMLGAIAGFFYGGIWSQNDPVWAIASAVGGGILALVATLTLHSAVRWAAFFELSAMAAYGFSFLMGAWAIAFYTAGELFPGLVVSLLTAGYLGLSLMATRRALRLADCSLGTSFCYADISAASFEMADLSGAHFEGAIGVPDWDNEYLLKPVGLNKTD